MRRATARAVPSSLALASGYESGNKMPGSYRTGDAEARSDAPHAQPAEPATGIQPGLPNRKELSAIP